MQLLNVTQHICVCGRFFPRFADLRPYVRDHKIICGTLQAVSVTLRNGEDSTVIQKSPLMLLDTEIVSLQSKE